MACYLSESVRATLYACASEPAHVNMFFLPRAVRLGAIGRVFELFHRFLNLGVPQLVVAFVAAVNGLGHRGKHHGPHVHELADAVVQREAVHAVHEGNHHLKGEVTKEGWAPMRV